MNIGLKTSGFTLAEILITIAIIGVVSALTIPSIIQKYEMKQTVIKLKKINNIMDNAIKMAIIENGYVDSWGLTQSAVNSVEDEDVILQSNQGLDVFIDKIIPHVKIIKRCKFTEKACKTWEPKNIAGKVYTEDTYAERLVFVDGIVLGHFFINSVNCSIKLGNAKNLQHGCGSFKIDLNGSKKPNTYGKDIFEFFITKEGIVPAGDTGFNKNSPYSFNSGCVNNAAPMNGVDCTAWVIRNENVDYLKCPDELSWDGKHSCN